MPGLDRIADLVPIDRGLTPASHFTFAGAVRDRGGRPRRRSPIRRSTARSSSRAPTRSRRRRSSCDLLHDGPKPVVVTGRDALRERRPTYDGPANLRDAVRVAASAAVGAADIGVVVVLDGTIEPADDVTKTHASAFDTFRSLNRGSLGRVDGDRRRARAPARGPRRHVADGPRRRARPPRDRDRRHGRDADRGAPCRRRGRASSSRRPAPGNTARGAPRGGRGGDGRRHPGRPRDPLPGRARPAPATRFPGGGATWVRAGAILAGHLTGPKARIALALGLGAGLDRDGLAALLADPAPIHDPDRFWETR